MQELDLYRIYFCEFEGKIVTAKIIAQTDKFLYVQLSNKEHIKIKYNELYNSESEVSNAIALRVKREELYKDYEEPTFA